MAGFDFSKLANADVLSVNETDESAARFYLSALAAVGIDPESLSFAEIVSVTRKCHGKWQGSDERREELEAIASAREAAAKADRLAALAKKAEKLLDAKKRDEARAAKRDEALAELREAGLID